ncbi:hypothetical protein SKAU_G00066520 [Synaphobranchus kaupii]|uniref:Uncharacterized protein n=1 Tax=Synaphobranchus kaupii TaxID=118154 RepID=A0A9Q1G5Z3_SYNKA|nr:hypothetical protein SKAU_G00066520 [Synaphobranchus kaupii]
MPGVAQCSSRGADGPAWHISAHSPQCRLCPPGRRAILVYAVSSGFLAAPFLIPADRSARTQVKKAISAHRQTHGEPPLSWVRCGPVRNDGKFPESSVSKVEQHVTGCLGCQDGGGASLSNSPGCGAISRTPLGGPSSEETHERVAPSGG